MNRTAEDRLRDVFALDENEPIPPVESGSLDVFHAYLANRISLPANVMYSEPSGEESDDTYRVTMIGLLDPDDHPVLGPYLGLMCEVTTDDGDETMTVPLSRIVDARDEECQQAIELYVRWFWSYR